MMQNSSKVHFFPQFLAKQLVFLGLALAVTLLVGPLWFLAQAQGPNFETSVVAAADGSSSIDTAEITFDAAYFAANGTLSGLLAENGQLVVAPGNTSGTFTSDTIASPLDNTTDLLPYWAATLSDGSSVLVETRISDSGEAGSWSDWAESPQAFFPVRNNEYGGAMAWIGGTGSIYVQYRLTLSGQAALDSFTMVLNDTTDGPADDIIAAQLPADAAAVCPAEKPVIVSRTQWGSPDGQNSPRWTPQPTEVEVFVVHHTGSPSSLTEWNQRRPYGQVSDWSAVVRAIWNHHANINGWGDVGYNYLIDPTGKIYEGRAGTQNGTVDVVGRHDGVNVGSMGVAFIGCYGPECLNLGLSNATPPQAMMNKGVELMAWKASENGIDPGTSQQYNYGGRLLNPIVGARDIFNTASPGDTIYNVWLPWLRQAVSDRVQCDGSGGPVGDQCIVQDIIFDQAAYDLNQTINFVARVTDPNGNPLGGATVRAAVAINEVAASATDGFDLVNQVGDYSGVFNNTSTPGTYTFAVTANHPDFASCSLSENVNVGLGDAPPTPTPGGPTPTPTPTPDPGGPTPTPTPTPNPGTGGPTVSFNPSPLSLPVSTANQKTDVLASNMPTLRGFDVTIRFDPNVVQVVDADPNRDGVQVLLGSQFRNQPNFVADNTVDNAAGLITFATVLLNNNAVSGDVVLIEINWQAVGGEGASTALTFERVDLVGGSAQAISADSVDGTINLVSTTANLSGIVNLQGRSLSHGVIVEDSSGTTLQSSLDGTFLFNNTDFVTLRYPGYLTARVEVGSRLAQLGFASDASGVSLGEVTLIAGDMDGNETIDVFDLVYMSNQYNTTDPLADLNADGIVNILDLALVANNYRASGPLTSWE